MNLNDVQNQPQAPSGKPELVEKQTKPTRKSVEAGDIAEPVRDLIASEFRVVKSSRRLAQKYRLRQHVINDILHLAARKQPQSEKLFVMPSRRLA